MKLFKEIWWMILLMVILTVIVGIQIDHQVNQIKKVGVKTIINEVWNGDSTGEDE